MQVEYIGMVKKVDLIVRLDTSQKGKCIVFADVLHGIQFSYQLFLSTLAFIPLESEIKPSAHRSPSVTEAMFSPVPEPDPHV